MGDRGRLDGRTALVTGGGSGIGRAVAARLHAEGAHVLICGRRAAALESACGEISPQGERIGFAAADLTTAGGMEAAVRTAAGSGAGLDILVNAAGVMRFGRLDQLEPAAMQSMFDINTFAPWRLTAAVLPLMRRRGGGAVVNVSSISGLRPFEGSGAYCMSKAALVMMTQVMALELARDRVRVNAVCPGMVEGTELGDAIFSPSDVAASYDRFRPLHPLGRNGTPADVAEAVLFLCADSSSWITGAVLPLDGGRHLTTNRPSSDAARAPGSRSDHEQTTTR
jgi:NAD(P)-dependent dehydrogenase (short-subunit alcohol dehydrogenase family)